MIFLRLLLLLLPFSFRREYGEELIATLEEQRAELGPRPPISARLRFIGRQALGLLRAAWRLRMDCGLLGAVDRPRALIRKALLLDTLPALHRNLVLGLKQDLLHGVRSLRKRPGTTAVAVLTLALGIGATTSIFATVRAVLLRPLPYGDAERILILRQSDRRDGTTKKGLSAANLRDLAASSTTFSAVSGAQANGFTLEESGRAISLRGWLVAPDFFAAIGAHTALGRTFIAAEHQPGRDKVVLLGYRTWQTRFGGDVDIVGRRIILDGTEHAVVGVLGPQFRYPSDAEIWAPRAPQPWDEDYRAGALMDGVARLAPTIGLPAAREELDRIAADLRSAYPRSNANLDFAAIPLRRHLFGDVQSPLVTLLGAVGLVLLIAAANVAGLQLARGAARGREFALRSALGAGSGRLLRMVTVESLLLAALGSGLGLFLAQLGFGLLRGLGPNHLPRFEQLRMDPWVVGFAVAAALASALLAALAPAFRASRADPSAALTEGARGSTKNARTGKMRDRLVIAEIAIAVILTIGAGLLIRSYDRLMDQELGFQPNGVLAVQLFAYDADHQPKTDFFPRVVAAIEALPAVEAVGLTTFLPQADGRSIWAMLGQTRFTVDDLSPTPEGGEAESKLFAIDGKYAAAMGIALRDGRHFSIFDDAEAARVVMVNEAFVRRHLPEGRPVGRRITTRRGDEVSRKIVGVLADVRPAGFESEPRPEIYLPLSQAPTGSVTLVVRSSIVGQAANLEELSKAVRETLWSVDPSQSIWASKPMSELLSDWNKRRRFDTVLLSLFAGLALILASIGVYGLVSFSVAERVGEMGIRRALGGQSSDILALVLRRGLALAGWGVLFGLAGSLALTHLLRSLLFGVATFDPLTFVTISSFVAALALVAAWLPARRATRVDPMSALRSG